MSNHLLMTVQSTLPLHKHAFSNQNYTVGFWPAFPHNPAVYSQGSKPETFHEKSLQINKCKQILEAYKRSVILLQILICPAQV